MTSKSFLVEVAESLLIQYNSGEDTSDMAGMRSISGANRRRLII